MKKNIIYSSIIVVTVIIGLLTYQYFNSFKEIVFSVKQTGVTVDIFKINKKDQKINTFTSNKTLSLQKGDYYYVVTSEKTDATHYLFTVADSQKTITVNPDYSTSYLSTLIAAESAIIQPIITSSYPVVMKNYDIFNPQLFQKGEWYGGILKYRTDDPNDIKDPYRIILHKENNTWVIIHQPEIVVTKTLFPTVPIDVLNSVNNLLDT